MSVAEFDFWRGISIFIFDEVTTEVLQQAPKDRPCVMCDPYDSMEKTVKVLIPGGYRREDR